jgi:hypothetical protein
MQTLRSAQCLTRLVLVWFALFIGVAVASPLVQPEGIQLVCTSVGSVKLVPSHGDGQDVAGNVDGMHCPLCLPVAAPPPAATKALAQVGLTFALPFSEQALAALLARLPWQARAPPSFS